MAVRCPGVEEPRSGPQPCEERQGTASGCSELSLLFLPVTPLLLSLCWQAWAQLRGDVGKGRWELSTAQTQLGAVFTSHLCRCFLIADLNEAQRGDSHSSGF